MSEEGGVSALLGSFSDEDFRGAMLRALRLVAVLAMGGALLCWWKLGWQSAALLLVGAGISASGLWEWLRLMTVVMARMDAGGAARPVAGVLVGFFLRLGLIVGVLYVSLRYLEGSVWALAAGLMLGIFALSIEGLRLAKMWTV